MIKRSLLAVFGVFFAAMYLMACCPKNPEMNVVKTAHGNTDWHIDTAEEFLTGKKMDGTAVAANHCPDSWTRTHMHVGLTKTENFYYDKDVTGIGTDNDETNGIDKPMLFFYAGHGEPEAFSTLGNSVYVSNLLLGNCNGDNEGTLRYYWQCSCEVFAHGPRYCGAGIADYSCPGDFDGSADSDAMRNVYERWGPRLDPAVRMACGSSSLAYCWESETNRIWDDYNNKGFDVADSFIDGLHRYEWNTPLCITTGGMSAGATPLFDTAFTNAPNPSGSYYHIQYSSSFASTVPMSHLDIPAMIPIFELMPLPLPEAYRKYGFTEKGEWMYSADEVKGRGPARKVNRNSGALYVFGERRIDEAIEPLKEEDYIGAAERVIDEQGWMEEFTSMPSGYRMLIESSPKTGKQADRRHIQKNVVVMIKREISYDGLSIPVLGAGGVMSFQLNNDGSVYNASKVWRSLKGVLRMTKSKSYDQAYTEAMAAIRDRDSYKLADWTWGYEEESGNVSQTEMRAVYVFNFLPRENVRGWDYPPIVMKISAHED